MEADRKEVREVQHKQLELLNDRMKETTAEQNSFQNRYMFGGLIAVIALLNADLVLLDESTFSICDLPTWVAAITLVSILTLAGFYFGRVTSRYLDFDRSHRSIKYKFELTLHSLLLTSDTKEQDYSRRLELSVKDDDPEENDPKYPESGARDEVLNYLLDHHKQRAKKLKKWQTSPFFYIAIILVGLTMCIRLLPLMTHGCDVAGSLSSPW